MFDSNVVFGIVGNIYEVVKVIVDRIDIKKKNHEESGQLHYQLTVLVNILQIIEDKPASRLMVVTLEKTRDKLDDIARYMEADANMKRVTKVIKAESIIKDLENFANQMSSLSSEISVYAFLNIESDDEDNKESLDGCAAEITAFLKVNKYKNIYESPMIQYVVRLFNLNAQEIKVMRDDLGKILIDSKILIKSSELQAMKTDLTERTSTFEIQYLKDLYVDSTNENGRRGDDLVFKTKWNGVAVAVRKLNFVPFGDPSTSTLNSKELHHYKAVLSEIEIYQKLQNCPNIIKFYGITTVEKCLGLVTEYVSNESLDYWIYTDPSKLSTEVTQGVVYGVAKGLSFLHTNKVAHNDVKSNNIMLNSFFQPVLFNFGMSRLSNITTSVNSLQAELIPVGTPQWKAPEYWIASPKAQKAIKTNPYSNDVYSYAVLLGELYIKEKPWDGYDNDAIREGLKSGNRPYESDEKIPSVIFELMEKCWTTEITDRLNMQQVLDYLLTAGIKPVKMQLDTLDVNVKGEQIDSAKIFNRISEFEKHEAKKEDIKSADTQKKAFLAVQKEPVISQTKVTVPPKDAHDLSMLMFSTKEVKKGEKTNSIRKGDFINTQFQKDSVPKSPISPFQKEAQDLTMLMLSSKEVRKGESKSNSIVRSSFPISQFQRESTVIPVNKEIGMTQFQIEAQELTRLMMTANKVAEEHPKPLKTPEIFKENSINEIKVSPATATTPTTDHLEAKKSNQKLHSHESINIEPMMSAVGNHNEFLGDNVDISLVNKARSLSDAVIEFKKSADSLDNLALSGDELDVLKDPGNKSSDNIKNIVGITSYAHDQNRIPIYTDKETDVIPTLLREAGNDIPIHTHLELGEPIDSEEEKSAIDIADAQLYDIKTLPPLVNKVGSLEQKKSYTLEPISTNSILLSVKKNRNSEVQSNGTLNQSPISRDTDIYDNTTTARASELEMNKNRIGPILCRQHQLADCNCDKNSWNNLFPLKEPIDSIRNLTKSLEVIKSVDSLNKTTKRPSKTNERREEKIKIEINTAKVLKQSDTSIQTVRDLHPRLNDFKNPQHPWNNLYDLEPQPMNGDVDKFKYITEPQLITRKSDLDIHNSRQSLWYLLNFCKFPAETFSIRLLTIKDIDPEIKRYVIKDNTAYTAFSLFLTKLGPFLQDREKWNWICYAIPVQMVRGTDLDHILNDPLPFIIAAKTLNLPDMKELYRLLDFNGCSFGLISYITQDKSAFEAKNPYYPLVRDFIESHVFLWMNKVWYGIIKQEPEKWIKLFCQNVLRIPIPYVMHRFCRVVKSRYGIEFLADLLFNFCVIPAYVHSGEPVPRLSEKKIKKFQSTIEKLLKSTNTIYTKNMADDTFKFVTLSPEISDLIKNYNFIKYCRLLETSLVLETIALQHTYSK